MNKLIFIVSLISTSLSAQTIIDVTETTLKIGAHGGEELFYYGFAEGDQLIFNFQEVNGKELKEIEITELPSSSKFMDYKSKKIENKTLNITKTGIYRFRFLNTALTGRICKIKIQRIPASETTKNFNSSVYWKTIYDTTYSTTQEEYLIKTDTTISNITDQTAKVHSVGNNYGNKTTFNFILPKNTVSWSYYIGVDQAGQQAYAQAMSELSNNASPIIARLPGYGPLAALALNCTSYLPVLQAGEDIDFYIVTGANVNLFLAGQAFNCLKRGKVINDFSKMTNPSEGQLHVCLSNDNAITGVNVAVKITAIVVTPFWGERPVTKMHIRSQQEASLKN